MRSHRTQTARRIQPPVQRRSLRIQAAITTRPHGLLTLESNTAGHDNIAEGFQALANNTTGSSNIALGSNAGINLTTGSNNIDIGASGTAGESKKIRIGKQGAQIATFIAGIYNVNEGGTIKPLYINRMVR